MGESSSHTITKVMSISDQIVGHEKLSEPALDFQTRAKQFELVCRDAAALEGQRRAMGIPEPIPAPWPQSTWDFLEEQTRRVRAST